MSRQDSRRLLSLIVAFILFIYFFPSIIRRPNTDTSSVQSWSAHKPPPGKNNAFAAFLAAPTHETEDDGDDLYFVGTRMLIYQLLHDPTTRTNNSYPFVVLVTKDVCK